MGYKLYGEDRTPPARWKEFVEWLVVMCLWFPTAIGGWLVFFGVSLEWMGVLTVLVAITAAWHFSKSDDISV
jgi:hypothetical protein